MDDVVIVGGGIIGAATAYFLSKEGRKVKVIERDPTYKTASFPLSLGGFRRQFYQKENILLGKFAKEFIFNISDTLKTKKNPNPTAIMVTNGYLLMFGPEHAEEQYKALEKLYKEYKDKNFIVVGFPSNNFLWQEPGTDDQIAEFCKENYGVSFPMMSKISVKGSSMHPLYKFLTKKSQNGKLDSSVSWNFQKFLIYHTFQLEDMVLCMKI